MTTTSTTTQSSILVVMGIVSVGLVAVVVLMPQPYNWIGAIAIGGPLFASIMAYKSFREKSKARIDYRTHQGYGTAANRVD